MFNGFESFALGVAVVWLAIGVVLSVLMSRRGHAGFPWLVSSSSASAPPPGIERGSPQGFSGRRDMRRGADATGPAR